MNSLDSRAKGSDIKSSRSEPLEWWDQFYTDMEKGLTKYTRPKDWKQRAENAETNTRKPVRNQYEERTSRSSNHE